MDISGRTVFIPGATSGIGLGLARRFADAGSTVVIGGRRQHLIDQITAEHERIEGVVIDTSDPVGLEYGMRVVEQVVRYRSGCVRPLSRSSIRE